MLFVRFRSSQVLSSSLASSRLHLDSSIPSEEKNPTIACTSFWTSAIGVHCMAQAAHSLTEWPVGSTGICIHTMRIVLEYGVLVPGTVTSK